LGREHQAESPLGRTALVAGVIDRPEHPLNAAFFFAIVGLPVRAWCATMPDQRFGRGLRCEERNREWV
jgi:hypothetical protein